MCSSKLAKQFHKQTRAEQRKIGTCLRAPSHHSDVSASLRPKEALLQRDAVFFASNVLDQLGKMFAIHLDEGLETFRPTVYNHFGVTNIRRRQQCPFQVFIMFAELGVTIVICVSSLFIISTELAQIVLNEFRWQSRRLTLSSIVYTRRRISARIEVRVEIHCGRGISYRFANLNDV